jgi:hypothetical protein
MYMPQPQCLDSPLRTLNTHGVPQAVHSTLGGFWTLLLCGIQRIPKIPLPTLHIAHLCFYITHHTLSHQHTHATHQGV